MRRCVSLRGAADRMNGLELKESAGSFLTMLVGTLTVVGGLESVPYASVMGGITMIFGALAYRSAKERKLGLKTDCRLWRLVEASMLFLVCIPLGMFVGLKGLDAAVRHPLPCILVPLGSVAAYIWICTARLERAENSHAFDADLLR